ncbi:MAG: glycoside hydrolase family 43 protein [Thermoguttaceae bacterium]
MMKPTLNALKLNVVKLVAPFLFLFALSFSALSTLSAEEAQDKGSDDSQEVYLMSYFLDNGQDGLHLCWSKDGLTWTALNGGKSLLPPTVGENKLMRDPSIVRGPDGTFYMVWTISWKEPGIGYASSKDLIHWSEQKRIPVMENDPTVRNCWAPEIFYDEVSETYYIFWSSTVPGKFGPGTSEDDLDHRQYYVSTKDFKTFSGTQLFFEPGHSVIDGFLAKEGDDYLLFYKDETLTPEPKKTINLGIGKSPTGPFDLKGEVGHTSWIEGPSALKIGDYWYLYYDCYTKGHYGAVRSSDLKNWENITDLTRFPRKARHGTTFKVSPMILDELLKLQPESDGKTSSRRSSRLRP